MRKTAEANFPDHRGHGSLANIQTGDTDPGWSFARINFAIREPLLAWDGYGTQTLATEGDHFLDEFVALADLPGVGLP